MFGIPERASIVSRAIIEWRNVELARYRPSMFRPSLIQSSLVACREDLLGWLVLIFFLASLKKVDVSLAKRIVYLASSAETLFKDADIPREERPAASSPDRMQTIH